MSRLILAGGGNEKDSKPLDKLLIKLVGKKKLLYIPVAWEGSYEDCKKWIASTFQALGFDRIETWTDLSNKSFDQIKSFGAIYIGGGNTFKLLHELKRTGFFPLLQRYMQDGGLVYGGSAGAVILGKDIGTAMHADANHLGLKNLDGLDVVNGYSVWCHYTEKDDILIEKYFNHSKTPVLILTEKNGLFIDGKKFVPLGIGDIFVYDKKGKRTLEQM